MASRTAKGIYESLGKISQEEGVDFGISGMSESQFKSKYFTGPGNLGVLHDKLNKISNETGIDFGQGSKEEWLSSFGFGRDGKSYTVKKPQQTQKKKADAQASSPAATVAEKARNITNSKPQQSVAQPQVQPAVSAPKTGSKSDMSVADYINAQQFASSIKQNATNVTKDTSKTLSQAKKDAGKFDTSVDFERTRQHIMDTGQNMDWGGDERSNRINEQFETEINANRLGSIDGLVQAFAYDIENELKNAKDSKSAQEKSIGVLSGDLFGSVAAKNKSREREEKYQQSVSTEGLLSKLQDKDYFDDIVSVALYDEKGNVRQYIKDEANRLGMSYKGYIHRFTIPGIVQRMQGVLQSRDIEKYMPKGLGDYLLAKFNESAIGMLTPDPKTKSQRRSAQQALSQYEEALGNGWQGFFAKAGGAAATMIGDLPLMIIGGGVGGKVGGAISKRIMSSAIKEGGKQALERSSMWTLSNLARLNGKELITAAGREYAQALPSSVANMMVFGGSKRVINTLYADDNTSGGNLLHSFIEGTGGDVSMGLALGSLSPLSKSSAYIGGKGVKGAAARLGAKAVSKGAEVSAFVGLDRLSYDPKLNNNKDFSYTDSFIDNGAMVAGFGIAGKISHGKNPFKEMRALWSGARVNGVTFTADEANYLREYSGGSLLDFLNGADNLDVNVYKDAFKKRDVKRISDLVPSKDGISAFLSNPDIPWTIRQKTSIAVLNVAMSSRPLYDHFSTIGNTLVTEAANGEAISVHKFENGEDIRNIIANEKVSAQQYKIGSIATKALYFKNSGENPDLVSAYEDSVNRIIQKASEHDPSWGKSEEVGRKKFYELINKEPHRLNDNERELLRYAMDELTLMTWETAAGKAAPEVAENVGDMDAEKADLTSDEPNTEVVAEVNGAVAEAADAYAKANEEYYAAEAALRNFEELNGKESFTYQDVEELRNSGYVEAADAVENYLRATERAIAAQNAFNNATIRKQAFEQGVDKRISEAVDIHFAGIAFSGRIKTGESQEGAEINGDHVVTVTDNDGNVRYLRGGVVEPDGKITSESGMVIVVNENGEMDYKNAEELQVVENGILTKEQVAPGMKEWIKQAIANEYGVGVEQAPREAEPAPAEAKQPAVEAMQGDAEAKQPETEAKQPQEEAQGVAEYISKHGRMGVRKLGSQSFLNDSALGAKQIAKRLLQSFKSAQDAQELHERITAGGMGFTYDDWHDIYKFFEQYKSGIITDKEVEALFDSSVDITEINSKTVKTEAQQPQEEIKPSGKGIFGNIYNQFKGKAKEAALFLLRKRKGEAEGVFHRDEIGDISLVYGNMREGLEHMIVRHIVQQNDFESVEDLLHSIDDVISNGEIRNYENNIIFEKDGYRAIVIRGEDGNWVLSAYDTTRSKTEKKRSETDASRLYQSIFGDEDGNLVPQSPTSTSKGTDNSSNVQENKEKTSETSNISADDALVNQGEFPKDSKGKDDYLADGVTAESALARMREKGLANDEIEQMMQNRLKKSKKPTMGDDEDKFLEAKNRYNREQEIYNGVLDLLKGENKVEVAPQSVIAPADGSVPDMSVDKASDARKRGFRSVSGVRYDRQKPVDGVVGKEVEIDFTTSEKPAIGRLKVVESDLVQPSHVGRQRNPLHFISEAQPKERTDAVSDVESDKIAQNISPERITTSTNAYGGAPIINERGEVIQGNNRATALRKMSNIPESREKYKQYLMEHAEEFGMKAEDIAKMKNPVLVRELKVSDEEAIRLGQFKASDLETGGIERIDPKSTISKMSQAQIADTMRRMFDVGGEGLDDKTIGSLIDDNGVGVLKYLRQIGAITDTQYQSAFNRNGVLTEEAKNDLRKLMLQNIFEGGADNLPAAFSAMPSAAQKALAQAMAGDMRLKESDRLLPEVQKAIMAVAEIEGSGFLNGKKGYKEVKQAIEDLSKQADAFAGEPIIKKYSELELELAARFLTGTQKAIKELFAQYQRDILGEKGDMFTPSEKLTKKESVKKTFDVELKEDNNNDVRGKIEEGQGDSSEDRLGGRGQSEGPERPADGEVNKPKTDIKNLSTEELEKRAKFLEVAAKTEEDLFENEEYVAIIDELEGRANDLYDRVKDATDEQIISALGGDEMLDAVKDAIEKLRKGEELGQIETGLLKAVALAKKEEASKIADKANGEKPKAGVTKLSENGTLVVGGVPKAEESNAPKQEEAPSPAKDVRREELKAEFDAAAQEAKDALLDFFKKKPHGSDKAYAMFIPVTEGQIKGFTRTVRAVGKLGYTAIKLGAYDFKTWCDRVLEQMDDFFREKLGWDEKNISDFLSEMWEMKFRLGDEVHTIKEWAESEKAKLAGDSAEYADRESKKDRFKSVVEKTLRESLVDESKRIKSITELRKIAKECGLENVRDTDLQEMVELAIVDIARKFEANKEISPKDRFDQVKRLYELQPSLNQRDTDRIMMQQYSTPAPMALLMGRFVNPDGKATSGLEPSAGNGMLTIGLPKEIMHVNEIDEARLSNLQRQGFKTVTNQDGTVSFGGKKYKIVVTNPPFGSALPKEYDGYTISGLEHQMAINALESMEDDGRAAIIIGGRTEYAQNGAIKGRDKAFLSYLYQHYDVVDVINMDGKTLYARQGTGYPTRMILINGRRTGEDALKPHFPPVFSKARAELVRDYDELYKRIEDDILRNKDKSADIRNGESGEGDRGNDRTDVAPADDKGVSGVRTTGRGEQPKSVATGGDLFSQPVGGGTTDGAKQVEGSGNAKGAGNDGVDKQPTPDNRGGQQPSEASRTATDESRQGGSGIPERPDNTQRPIGGNGEPVGNGQRRTDAAQPKRGLGTEKVPYRQQSSNPFSLHSLMPAEQADQVKAKLEELGDVDAFVTNELGYSSVEEMHAGLAAEQVDSVALAIHQMNNGSAFIIGDQTGIGKGRQAAALIRYGVKKGGCPVFITVKKGLFSDMYRDLCDIGSPELRPFIWAADDKEHSANVTDANGNTIFARPNEKEQKRVVDYINKHGKLPPEYDYVVTTYDSFKSGTKEYENGEKKDRKFGKKQNPNNSTYKNGQAKRDALEALAQNSYVIMDESHNAGGEGSNVSGYLQYITAKAKGTTFLSATFAKRPGNMPIYSLRTAISKAGVAIGDLIDAVKRGGATFQEIMSKALTEAGQMIRRERDMTGVTIDWRGIEDEEVIQKQREQYDTVIGLFNEIIDFQKRYVDPIVNELNDEAADVMGEVNHTPGTRDMGINNTPFASRTYNIVQQVLLSLKAEESAKRAIEHMKQGRKAVIAVANTNEGAAGLASNMGEDMEMPDLSVNLKKGLEGVLRITNKNASGDRTNTMIPLERLSDEARQRYAEIMEHIESASSGLSLSPIDVMKNELRKAGYKVGELTGRTAEFVYNEDGTVRRVKRTDTDKKKIASQFNNGELDALILNRSAGTGISLHASSKFKDQRPRIMIVAQAQGDVNDEVQIRGRIDRTGQVARGMYEYVVSNIPSEQRLLMMLKSKLRSLDANTTSSQKSKFNEMQVQDVMNKYGDEVLIQYLAEHPDTYAKLADPLKLGEGFEILSPEDFVKGAQKADGDGATASKILGRMALLTVKEQEAMLDDITELYTAEINRLNDMGENDLEITEMPLRAKTLDKKVWEEGAEPNSGNPFADNTYVETVEMDILKKPMKASEVKASQERLLNGRTYEEYRKEQTGKLDKWQEEKKASLRAEYEERALRTAEKEREKYLKAALKNREKSGMTEQQCEDMADAQYKIKYDGVMDKLDTQLRNVDIQRRAFDRVLEQFDTDHVYVLPSDIYDLTQIDFGSHFGKVIGIKISNNFSTASSTVTFATLDGRRKITVPVSGMVKNKNGEKSDLFKWIDINTKHTQQGIKGPNAANTLKVLEMSNENWDKMTSSATRKKGYIVTGNLLQALVSTKQQNIGGKLISYTTDTGEVRQGLLMSDTFDPKSITGTKPISDAYFVIAEQHQRVTSADGDVTIDWRYGDMYSLRVPKSVKSGGKYFQDAELLDIVDDNSFYTRGGGMFADIRGEENLKRVLGILSKMKVSVQTDNEGNINPNPEVLHRQSGYTEEQNNIRLRGGDDGIRLSTAQKRALETAVPSDNSPFKATVVSSADGAKVINNLETLAKKTENLTSGQKKSFLKDVAESLGAKQKGSDSQYATFETKNGRIVTIRLANHSAKVSTFDNHGESNGISIVVSRKPNEGIKNDGNAHIVEFFYSDKKLNKAEGKPLADIVRSIQQSLYSGEYKDTTGLAERQEVNAEQIRLYSSQNKVAEHTPQHIASMRSAVQSAIDGLGGKGKVVTSEAELDATGRRALKKDSNMKGYYDIATGDVVVYLPNCESGYDAVKTVMHEKVGHEGLRQALGEEGYRQFYTKLWMSLSEAERKAISEKASRRKWDFFGEAMGETLAEKAEDFTDEGHSFIESVKDALTYVAAKLGINRSLTPRDVRIALWLSKNRLTGNENNLQYKLAKAAFEAKVRRYAPKEPTNFDGFKFTKDDAKAIERATNGDYIPSCLDGVYDSDGNIRTKVMSEEEREALDRSLTPAGRYARTRYEDDLKRVSYLWTEGHQNNLAALDIAQNSIAGGREKVKDSENALWELNHLGGKDRTEQDAYEREYVIPLRRQISRMLPNLDGKDSYEKFVALEHYVTAKDGLEKNRAFAVRDYRDKLLRKAGRTQAKANSLLKQADALQAEVDALMNADPENASNKKVEEEKVRAQAEKALKEATNLREKAENFLAEYDKKRNSLVTDLTAGKITLRDFYAELDSFIGETIDKFDVSKADRSGLSDSNVFPEWAREDKGAYDDSAVIEHVMEIESRLGKWAVEDLWSMIDKMAKFAVEKSYISGEITKEAKDRANTMFTWYVPLRGFDADTAEDMWNYLDLDKSGVGRTLMGAKGRTSASDSPLNTLMLLGNSAILRGNRNVAKQALVRLVRNNPNDLISEYETWYKVGEDAEGNTVLTPSYPELTEEMTPKQIADAIREHEEKIKEEMENGVAVYRKLKDSPKNMPYRVLRPKQMAQHFINVNINGKPVTLVVHSHPRVAQAVNGMLVNNTRGLGAVKWLNSQISQLATSKSATFIARNAMRDYEFASLSIASTESAAYLGNFQKMYWQLWGKALGNAVPGTAIEIGNMAREAVNKVKNGEAAEPTENKSGVVNSMRILFKKQRAGELNTKKKPNGEYENEVEGYFDEFVKGGGVTGYVQLAGLDTMKEKTLDTLDSYFSNSTADKVKKMSAKTIGKVFKTYFDAIEAVNEAVENQARFSAYYASRKAGRTRLRATQDAKNVSVNFNKTGSGSAVLSMKFGDSSTWYKANRRLAGSTAWFFKNSMIFYNAGVQGMSRTAQMWLNGGKGTKAKLAGMIGAVPFMLGASLPYLNGLSASALDDDDDRKKYGENPYLQLPDYERRHNICLYMGKGRWFKIPVFIEGSTFFGLGDIAAGYSSYPELLGNKNVGVQVAEAVTQVSPVDAFGGSKVGANNVGGAMLGAVTPSLMQPTIAMWTNVGWTGSPISRSNEWNEYDPNWTKGSEKTQSVYVDIAHMLNSATGGKDAADGTGVTKGAIDLDPAKMQYLVEQYFSSPGKEIVSYADILSSMVEEDKDVDWGRAPVLKAVYRDNTPSNIRNNDITRWYSYVEDSKKTEHDIREFRKHGSIVDARAKMDSKEGRQLRVIKAYAPIIKKLKTAKNMATRRADANLIQEKIAALTAEAMDRIDEIEKADKEK